MGALVGQYPCSLISQSGVGTGHDGDAVVRVVEERVVRDKETVLLRLLDNGAAVIACSHLGKPKGTWKESLTLAPVAKRLSELLGMEVIFAKDIIGEDAKAKAAALQPGQLLLLENLRFDPREEKNDPEFAKELASIAEIYVSDAFGTVHRAHASTAGVAAYLPAYAGLLIEKELSVMGKALEDPKRPFVAILGGAKVSDKIGVINNLLEKADTIIRPCVCPNWPRQNPCRLSLLAL